jgi:CRISPR-associated endonuclease/helicase Cas3
MNFADFFQHATGHAPYDYQCRLACGGKPENLSTEEWLRQGTACRSQLIHIPTGLGKTAAVVLAWLWNRLGTQPSAIGGSPTPASPWPRRLVYCLPMRALVEQTRDNVELWLKNLSAKAAQLGITGPALEELVWLALHSPIVLMGGEELDPARGEWDLHPEKPAILIGTQDMLLSRALNRGYGMSRYRWPMHFALLNNDCLWVMDETQLMGVGVETSAQLDGFRSDQRMPTSGACPTWWMSATLADARLATVDHPRPTAGWPMAKLEAADLARQEVKDRFEAKKPLEPASVVLSADTRKTYAVQLARFIADHHQHNSLTLVVLNRVDRAQEVYQQLQKLQPSAALALVHSRFRPDDRRRHEAVLHGSGSRIVVATQAVEAGVDVSARTLITELAPWPALVQRFGRCNRSGEFKGDEARVFWVDLCPKDDADELARPYTAHELNAARPLLQALTDAGPATLKTVAPPPEPPAVRPVLRRKDLVELFDTTPDLAGHDLDISRFIRDGDDTDAQVFWRDLGGRAPAVDLPEPVRRELCRVSLGRFADFMGKLAKETTKLRERTKDYDLALGPFVWNPLEEQWEAATRIRPGAAYLLGVQAGGYSADLGWVGAEQINVPVTSLGAAEPSAATGYAGDPSSFARAWVTLADHTRAVVDEATRLASALAADLAPVFLIAARWHDVGKAHEAFQRLLRGEEVSRADQLWAKSANPSGRCQRRFFRHELASALAWLQTAPPEAPERDLVAYLVAAHHGKVRLSIRSLPGEEPPPDRAAARLARGILDGDPLGPVEMEGLSLPVIALDLSFMEMGWDAEREPRRGPSWLARMIALRDRFGPFRLAYLETLLRAADARASARGAGQDQMAVSGVSSGMELREEPAAYQAAEVLSPAEQSLVADLVADGLSIQDKFRPEPLYKQTGKGHYDSGTVEEIRQAKKEKGTPS